MSGTLPEILLEISNTEFVLVPVVDRMTGTLSEISLVKSDTKLVLVPGVV